MRKMVKWTEEELNKLFEYKENGLKLDQIYNLFNGIYKKQSITYQLSKVGLNNYRWTLDELNYLKNICEGKTYKELESLIPNRSRDSIEMKVRQLDLSHLIANGTTTWTDEEENILISKYPHSTNDELCLLIPKKTSGSINTHAQRLQLKKNINILNKIKTNNSRKSKLYWNKEKEKKLISFASSNDIHKIYALFPEHTSKFIEQKMRELGLIDKTNLSKVKMILNKNYLDNLNLNDILLVYKKILSGDIEGFSFINLDREQIIFVFKYYLKKSNLNLKREDWLHVLFGDILGNAKLRDIVKNNFSGYYEFITYCFPQYKFKVWEFKKLDVPNNYWKEKRNCYYHIESIIHQLIQSNILNNKTDLFLLGMDNLKKFFNKTMISLCGWNIFIEYFTSKGIDCSQCKALIYEDILFDSKEELEFYKELKSRGIKIKKCGKNTRFYNKKHREGYIPDFIVNDDIIIEYFGLYGNNNRFGYDEKTLRKIDFYSTLDEYQFIDAYPNDKRDNFDNIINKINILTMAAH